MSAEEIKTIPIYREGILIDDGNGRCYPSGVGEWSFDGSAIEAEVRRGLEEIAAKRSLDNKRRNAEIMQEQREHDVLVLAGLRESDPERPRRKPYSESLTSDDVDDWEHSPTVIVDDVPIASLRSIPAELKMAIIKAMGFRPMGEMHTRDCPAAMSSGIICQCVPGPTEWSPPNDVMVHMGETWEERLAAARARKARRES